MAQSASRTLLIRRRTLRSLGLGVLWFSCHVAPVFIGSLATIFVASAGELPLRNLLVEVRQVQVAHDAAGNRDLHDTVLSQQQVLVLNGRSGQVALRTTVPMRLMAVAFRNGRPTLVPGVVLLDATTGLVVAPRWDGTEFVELDLAASQAGSSRTPGQGAATASTVVVPLGDWTRVAESDQVQSSQRSNGLGNEENASSLHYAVQVRISVR